MTAREAMNSNVAPLTETPPQRDDLSLAKRRLLEERLRGLKPAAAETDRIQPRSPAARIPISAEQSRIWLHASAHPEVPLYNESVTIHRRGSFDAAILNTAWREILRRHQAWRTSFSLVDGDMLQVVHSTPLLDLPFLDLTTLPASERESEALRLATEDARRPILLDEFPLLRARVVRLAPDDHRLYLTLHHIIFDGVSIYRILMPELATIYDALAAGIPIPLPEPTLQYADYALWRQQHLRSPAVARQLAYWKTQLAGKLPLLHLPADRPRPSHPTHRGAMVCFSLSAASITALRALSRSHGVTLYMTLLAGFKALLFRYSGQPDLIVGGVTDARRRPELEPVMGYFLDTFALRSAPSAEKPFAQFLIEVRDTVLGALAAVDVPFDHVVQAVQAVEPSRDRSHHPIFQAFFSIEPPVAPFRDGWDLTQMDVEVGAAKFDLYLELDERPDHMAARLMYSTDLFEAATIERMAAHWQVLLAGVCRDPTQPLGDLPILTPAEITQLTGPGSWNDTARPFPAGTLHDLIAAQARRTPDRVAATFNGTSWTCAQLIARAEALAAALHATGAGRGTLVAVLLPRSLDLLAALVAVLRTGAAYLPLDPDNPPARIALSLDDAQPVALLTTTALLPTLPATTAHVLCVDADLPNQAAAAEASPTNATTAEDLAYVIHTSGSTGRPKAVEITHTSVVNLLASMAREPGFRPDDILLAVTTVSFDIAALELFLPLVTGGHLILASRDTAQDPYLLAALIETSGATVMQATPATWRALLAIGWRAPTAYPHPPLRALCGGEPLPRDLADRLLATGVDLWNMYGPTETTIWSTLHHVTGGTGPVPIGRPIANTIAHILDARRNLLPVGVQGDLHLGGAGLARGYRGLPQLTAERFVEVPAAGHTRLYATGDLAVRRADGSLECLGRMDHQVKVRGFRVELEAVEAAALRHPQVAAAAARVWPDPAGGMRLSLYLVGLPTPDGLPGTPPATATLRAFLARDLPDFMIPSDVVPIDALPLTANRKIDRAALPRPAAAAAADLTPQIMTETEKRLAALWSELLGTAVTGIDDDFFNLGGHSLLVATLQQRIDVAFGQRLPMAALFYAPTLRQQAALLEVAAADAPAPPRGLLALQPRGTRPPLFWLHPPPEILNLAAALGDDQPLLGLTLAEDDVAALRGTPDIRTVAARHVETILGSQPHGPYHLGGFCTGGIVAFETAAQLRARGHEVATLLLLDAQNPVFYKRINSLALELSKVNFYLRQNYNGVRTQKSFGQRMHARLRKIWNNERLANEMDAVEELINLAAYRYRPDPYPGDVLLLRPADRPTRLDHLPGWQATVSGRMLARDIAGHHEDLFDPQRVPGLAREIAASIALTGGPGQ